MTCTRRAFLGTVSTATVGASTILSTQPVPPKRMPPVCIFSKHLQFLEYTALAAKCRELGLDGVDLTVRNGGHVLPSRVDDDLPQAVEAMEKEGLSVCMITTGLLSGEDPTAEPILRAASRAGIPYFRCGYFQYNPNLDPMEELPVFTRRLRSLAEIAKQYGLTGGYHNHSGRNTVGGALWDLAWMLDQVDIPEHMGSNFDVGHTMAEGAQGAWEATTRRMKQYIKMIAVKDFSYVDGSLRWVPLGQGQVDMVSMLRIIRDADFKGPVSLHFEYPTESHDNLYTHIGKAAIYIRNMLVRAGYEA